MQKTSCCNSLMTIIAGVFLAVIAGSAIADECTKNCADDLKACRKQADTETNREEHPMILDSSATRMYKGQESAMAANKMLPTVPNDEIQKRVDERYRECANANANCLSQCTTASAKPKISVILK